MSERSQPNPSQAKATTTESFKCSNCGRMYPTEGRREAVCPGCGHTCTPDQCKIVAASSQGY